MVNLRAGKGRALLPGAKLAFDYYVDSVRGADSNAGLTAATAKQTLAAVATLIGTQPSKRIGMARGSSWNASFVVGSAGNLVNGTQVDSYGSGALPLIDGSTAIPNANFSLAGGQTLTYTAALTFSGSPAGGSEQRIVWENGKFLVQASSIANCEATAGSFFYDSYVAASANVYVHASDGSNVISNGKLYEYTNIANGIALYGNNCRVANVRTRRQRDNNGSLVLAGDYSWAVGCIVEDGHKHCAYTQEGGGFDGCTFKNAYNGIAGFPNYLVFNKDVGMSLGMTARNCTFLTDISIVPGAGVTPAQFASSVISHTNVSGNLGPFSASNNTHTLGNGYGIGNAGNQTIVGDTWTNCSSIGGTADAVNVAISNSIVNSKTVALTGTIRPFFTSNNPASGRLAVAYTSCTINTGTGSGRVGGNSLDMTLTNCSVVTGSVGDFPVGAIRFEGSGGTLTVNGTTIDGRLWTGPAYINLASDTTYVGDNNTFMHTAGTPAWQRANATQATTLPGWQTYSGQDAHSTAS